MCVIIKLILRIQILNVVQAFVEFLQKEENAHLSQVDIFGKGEEQCIFYRDMLTQEVTGKALGVCLIFSCWLFFQILCGSDDVSFDGTFKVVPKQYLKCNTYRQHKPINTHTTHTHTPHCQHSLPPLPAATSC